MKSFSRRALLQGLAGSAGGLALVPIMARLTGAQSMPTSRFVFIVEGNCFEPITLLAPNAQAWLGPQLTRPLAPTDRWWPGSYHHDATLTFANTDFASTPALASIHANGLDAQTAVVFGMSSKITGGGHSAMHGVLSSSRTLSNSPGGITIDAYLGSLPAVRQSTPYDVVRLGVNGDPTRRVDFGTCAYGAGNSAALILQPSAAFSVLFGSVSTPADQASFARRGRLLDYGAADVNAALATFSGNSAERAKLESYLTALETVDRRQAAITALAPQLAAARPATPDVNPLYTSEAAHPDVLNRFAAQLELATAALKGDLTNVVVVGSGTGGAFDMLYPSEPVSGVMRHPLHHGSATTPSYLATIHDVTRRQVDAIARMAHDLASTPDPTGHGTMLDTTVIVYIADNGEQHHSTASEFPVLLIGGRGLGLNTGGRTVVLPGLSSANHRQVSNLWNTLGHAAGNDLNLFGAEGRARVAPGPLSDLLG